MSDPTTAATPVFPGADTSPEHLDRLRARRYNATITRIRDQHAGLWVMHVEPDAGVCVRYRRDLAYLDRHQLLQETYPKYRYVALTTREPGTGDGKVYIQDLLESGGVDRELGERMIRTRPTCSCAATRR